MRLLAALTVSAFLLLDAVSHACDCAQPPPPKKALEQSAAVFSGKVVNIEADRTGGARLVTFEVERSWKGVDGKTVTVSTSKSGASCGYTFKEGGAYLVYCHPEKPGGGLWTGLCSRTRSQADAKGDIDEIGEGKVVEDKAKKD